MTAVGYCRRLKRNYRRHTHTKQLRSPRCHQRQVSPQMFRVKGLARMASPWMDRDLLRDGSSRFQNAEGCPKYVLERKLYPITMSRLSCCPVSLFPLFRARSAAWISNDSLASSKFVKFHRKARVYDPSHLRVMGRKEKKKRNSASHHNVGLDSTSRDADRSPPKRAGKSGSPEEPRAEPSQCSLSPSQDLSS